MALQVQKVHRGLQSFGNFSPNLPGLHDSARRWKSAFERAAGRFDRSQTVAIPRARRTLSLQRARIKIPQGRSSFPAIVIPTDVSSIYLPAERGAFGTNADVFRDTMGNQGDAG